MSSRQRVRLWWARRKVKKALSNRKREDRREFVYLDEVSVYSLMSSRLGPVVSELTESQSSTLTAEANADLELNTGIGKGKTSTKLQGARTRGTQVLRKATIQATFKQLLEVEEPLIATTTSATSNEAIVFPTRSALEDSVGRGDKNPWIINPETLRRGELVELVVEAEVDPIYRVSSIIDTFTDLVSEGSSTFGSRLMDQLSEATELNRLLDKLMVGLIPIKCKSIDFKVARIAGREVLLHRNALAGVPENEWPETFDLYVTGVTDEQMYWKDIRRSLFSSHRYQMLCRINVDGLQRSWNPIKLVQIFGPAGDQLLEQFHSLSNEALNAFTRSAAENPEGAEVASQSDKLIKFAELLVASEGAALDTSALVTIERVASELIWNDASIDEMRYAFDSMQEAVEQVTSITFDREKVVELRSQVRDAVKSIMVDQTVRQEVREGEGDATTPQAMPSRILDTEIVAIYW